MATIKDVARMANVSVSTVSKYLNGGNVRTENIETIRNAIETLDYRINPFARSLKAQRNRSVGVLLPDMAAPFFGSVVSALDKVLREQGLHCLVSTYSSNHGLERDYLRFLITNGIDGLIYMPENLTAEEFYELTGKFSIPTVLVDRLIQGVDADAVLVNNADAVYDGVSRLIEKGHKRVAIITGYQSIFTAKERLVGYLRALSDHGILYDDALVISGEHKVTEGYRGFETLMNLPDPPTAIFTTNYDITIGLVTAIRERGLHIPEDMDVFGFDCADLSTILRKPIPVVYQPEAEIGQTAAAYLLDRLGGYVGEGRITRLSCHITP